MEPGVWISKVGKNILNGGETRTGGSMSAPARRGLLDLDHLNFQSVVALFRGGYLRVDGPGGGAVRVGRPLRAILHRIGGLGVSGRVQPIDLPTHIQDERCR